MIDELAARKLAEGALEQDDIGLGDSRELQEGWFFPYRTGRVGCNGVIVSKRTGRLFHLGSAFAVERDLALYDAGYQSEQYDLVVLAIHDLDATRRVVGKLPLQVVEPTYEHGQVWRVPRTMTDLERWRRLEKLVMGNSSANSLFERWRPETLRALAASGARGVAVAGRSTRVRRVATSFIGRVRCAPSGRRLVPLPGRRVMVFQRRFDRSAVSADEVSAPRSARTSSAIPIASTAFRIANGSPRSTAPSASRRVVTTLSRRST